MFQPHENFDPHLQHVRVRSQLRRDEFQFLVGFKPVAGFQPTNTGLEVQAVRVYKWLHRRSTGRIQAGEPGGSLPRTADAPKRLVRANEKFAVGHRHGSNRHFADRVCGQRLELGTGTEHKSVTALVDSV